ncbi:MAG: HlyD family efflux transporter periplasmic adaptor subunit [Bradymonadia bacterium]
MNRLARPNLTTWIWVAAALAAGVLYWRSAPDHAAIPGVVEIPRHAMGSTTAGRLLQVLVRPGQKVSVGEVVATLDAEPLNAEIGVARAELAEALAEADALAATLQLENRERRRAISSDLAKARAALAAAKGEQAAARAEARVIGEQLGRLDAAARSRISEAGAVSDLQVRVERLDQTKQHQPEVVRAWTNVTADATSALAAIRDEETATRLAPLRARVETRTTRLTGLLEMKDRLVLRAPVEGVVSRVLKQQGDTVTASEPIVVVVAAHRAMATAYAPEEVARRFELGRAVEVVGRDRSLFVRGHIEAVGPEIMELPRALWVSPDRPKYGRPVFVNLAEDAPVLASEVVSVSLSGPVSGALAATPSAGALLTLEVPAALSARTRFEPSGAVWIDEWKRYLVVSDDTGRGPTDAAPWVFTLDGQGVVDAEPVVVQGLEAVSDLEAVARAADGTVWLLSSQSLSRKGQRPEKRQGLIRGRIEVEPRRLVVTGRVALFDRVSAALGPEARSALGWNDTLDLEGLAFLDGTLLLGAKSPADEVGRARILRLSAPDAFVEGAAPDLEVYAELSLPTCGTGAPGGISELAVEGTTLWILSTLPTGPDCGAVWRTDARAPGKPTLVRRFEGLKAEGFAVGPEGRGHLFFDMDERAPRWTSVELKAP